MATSVELVERVWEAYKKFHPRAVLSPERIKLISRRVDEGYPVDLLVDAIVGNHQDPHSNGENDRSTEYHSLGLILRDADHIERYAELAVRERRTDPVEGAWEWYERLVQSGSAPGSALDLVEGNVPDEIAVVIRQRVEGDELGRRRA